MKLITFLTIIFFAVSCEESIQLEDLIEGSLKEAHPYTCDSVEGAIDFFSIEEAADLGTCTLALEAGVLKVTFDPDDDYFNSTDTCIVDVRTNIFGGQVIRSVEFTFDYSGSLEPSCSESVLSSTTTGPGGGGPVL